MALGLYMYLLPMHEEFSSNFFPLVLSNESIFFGTAYLELLYFHLPLGHYHYIQSGRQQTGSIAEHT